MTTDVSPPANDATAPSGSVARARDDRGGTGGRSRRDWDAIRTVVRKDLTAVRRSKAITLPMIIVPVILLVFLPFSLGALAKNVDPGAALQSPLVKDLLKGVVDLPEQQQLPVLVLCYLLSPLLLVLPLMVSAVLAADAFAGEKERRTLEGLLHLPIADRDLFLAKLLSAFLPALGITWGGAVVYALVANLSAWSATGRLIIPFAQWLVMMLWVAPAVATLSLGLLVLVSSRAKTTQEANQLGGAVILPLIFVAASQVAPLLLAPLLAVFALGAIVWALALGLVSWSARRFTRDRLATSA
jgi:ABC-type Na+ efflux pump permease subunit